MPTIYTVGHSNKPGDAFVSLLQTADIEWLVDVRTYPRSRYNPQFNQAELQHSLERNGIRYIYKGKNLGGLAGNVDFDGTLDRLVEQADQGHRIALMCSEADPKDCHRKSDLTPALLGRGAIVEHILWTGEVVTDVPPPPCLFDDDEAELRPQMASRPNWH